MKQLQTKCNECGVYVTANEFECYNCGQYFWRKYRKHFAKKIVLPLLTVLLTVFFIAVSFLNLDSWTHLRTFFLFFLILECLIYGFLFASLFTLSSYSLLPRLDIERKTKREDYLSIKIRIIKKRILELSKRKQQIDEVLNKVSDEDDKQFYVTKNKLLIVQEEIENQIFRYCLQSVRVDLIRIQQNLTPLLSNMFDASYGELKINLRKVEDSLTYISKLNKIVQEEGVSNKLIPEKTNVLLEIVETGTSCEKLRKAILNQQATKAVSGISPHSDTLNNNLTPIILEEEITKFNIQVEITDFSNNFAELEAEYQSFKDENDLNPQVAESSLKKCRKLKQMN